MTRVRRPVSSFISSSAPTAWIIPSRIARAWTNPDGCAGVRIFPFATTRSASVLLTAIASHPGPGQGNPVALIDRENLGSRHEQVDSAVLVIRRR